MEDPVEVIQAENSQENFLGALRDKAAQYNARSQEISSPQLQGMRETVTSVAQNLPEATLVGGVALRVLLDLRGYSVPEFFGADYDYSIPRESYQTILSRLPIPSSNQTPVSDERTSALQSQYRVKGAKENTPWGKHNFLENPQNYIALEDRKNFAHLDLFVQTEPQDEEVIEYYGQYIRLLSTEQLFIQSARELRNQLAKGQVQFRKALYFYLAGTMIDEAKMNQLWKGYMERGQVSPTDSWKEVILGISTSLDKAEKEGKITKEVIH